MTVLQASSNITNSAATQGAAKSFLDNIRLFVADLLGTDSSNKVAVAQALGTLFNSSLAKSAAYTVVAADRGKVITCTGTFTLSIAAAATLADGYYVAVWNTGAGTITIDPNGAELIDGAATKALTAGKLAVLYCNGSQFVTVGSIATGAGSGLDADLLDGQHASAFSKNDGSTMIGIFTAIYGDYATNSPAYSVGSIASNLPIHWAGITDGVGGSWKCLYVIYTGVTYDPEFGFPTYHYRYLFQRIA